MENNFLEDNQYQENEKKLNKIRKEYISLLKTEKLYKKVYSPILRFYKYIYRLDINTSPMYRFHKKIQEKADIKNSLIKPYTLNPFLKVKESILYKISDIAENKAKNIEYKFLSKNNMYQLENLYKQRGNLTNKQIDKMIKYEDRIEKVTRITDNMKAIKQDKRKILKEHPEFKDIRIK